MLAMDIRISVELVGTFGELIQVRRTSLQKFELEETCESDNPCRGPPLGRTRKIRRSNSFAWEELDTVDRWIWSDPSRLLALKVHAVKRGEGNPNPWVAKMRCSMCSMCSGNARSQVNKGFQRWNTKCDKPEHQ